MLTIQHKTHGHCATICPIADGYLIAYYLHPECSNTQKVQLRYVTTNMSKLLKNEYKVIAQYTFYNKTGNCILIPDPINKSKATIIYSYFNDTDGTKFPTRNVHRWMYCSNWIADVTIGTKRQLHYLESNIKIDNIKPFPTQPTTGFLVRINPIKVHDQWLLPMYHENPCYGQIMKSTNTKDWRTSGHIGLHTPTKLNNKSIQPSLWWDGTTLYSLSRDMSGKGYAWYSESSDLGESWSEIIQTNITNDNNSIAVINDNTKFPYAIWNEGEKRRRLILGRLQSSFSISPIIKLNTLNNASYPNYCIDDNKIHIVHTEYATVGPALIMHHIIDKQELDNYKDIKRETIIIDENLQTKRPNEKSHL